MQELYNSNTDAKVVQTNAGVENGQDKCPKCGATEISLNSNTGMLRCNFCRHEFKPEKVEEFEIDVSQLEGQIIGSGAQDIVADTNDVVTLKCSSCGAEVVIDTAEAMQARCHWCRNTLSINEQIPNGSVPDVVLPFNIKKEEATGEIDKFVSKRKFFALKKFKEEFTTQNVMGVYFPYMLVDVNAHANFIGRGEHQIRKYYRGSGDNKKAYYDAELYHVEREFDIAINNLSVESSADKLDTTDKDKTNNIINSIMPFDVENCVKWNANYLKGYSSEKRDTNVEQLRDLVNTQSKDIARFAANDTLEKYDRGVAWDSQQFGIKGQQWKAAYLPVWLYSYQQVKGNKKFLHYIAVNARTKETMGSVPIDMPKLFGVSALVEVASFISTFLVDFEYEGLLLFMGLIYFLAMFVRYRNNNARHTYEKETKRQIFNLRGIDDLLQVRRGLRDSMMAGANNKSLEGQSIKNKAFESMTAKNVSNSVVNSMVKDNPLASFIKNNIDNGGRK